MPLRAPATLVLSGAGRGPLWLPRDRHAEALCCTISEAAALGHRHGEKRGRICLALVVFLRPDAW